MASNFKTIKLKEDLMFKKIKINYIEGKTRLITCLGVPIFEYGIYKGKKFSRILLFNTHVPANISNQVFFLKINKFDESAKLCMNYWLQVAKYINATIIILCDHEYIISNIQKEFIFPTPIVYFINSERKKFKNFLKNLELNPWWYNAAYAHLTTLDYAIKNGFAHYWNIDGDDTMFMIEPKQLSTYMLKIQKYAKLHDISLFSLDMHHSHSNSYHWSYGITYTQNPLKILDSFTKTENITQWKDYKEHHPYCNTPLINIDWFTTFIRSQKELKIDTFYIDNIYFLHFSNPLLYTNHTLSYFSNNKIIYPIFKDVYGLNHIMISYVPISKNDIKFHFDDISLDISKEFMKKELININYKINCAKALFDIPTHKTDERF